MEPTVTVMKENGKCSFYIDDFSGFTSTSKYALVAAPLTFIKKGTFTVDTGSPTFVLPLEDAKEMAREILELGENKMDKGRLSDAIARLIQLNLIARTAFIKAEHAHEVRGAAAKAADTVDATYEALGDAETAAKKAEKVVCDFADDLIEGILNNDLSKLKGF